MTSIRLGTFINGIERPYLQSMPSHPSETEASFAIDPESAQPGHARHRRHAVFYYWQTKTVPSKEDNATAGVT